MVMDYSGDLMFPSSQNFSADKFALTIEKFDGRVHETMQNAGILDSVFEFRPLVGTDTMSNNVMGNPTLQKVEAGVEPAGKQIEVGKQIVQVKTPIIARVIEAMLPAIQDHLDIKSRTPANFGKRIAKSIDEVLFVQIVKSVLYDDGAGDGSGGILPKGTVVNLGAGGDELLADELTTAVYDVAQGLAEGEIEMYDGKLYMAPAQYFTLLKNQDLLNADFNKDNGSFAHASIHTVSGMPIVMTNRISQAVDTVAAPAFTDSTASLYGAAYETSAAEAKAVALFATPDSIMVAQSIPLTSDVYWDKKTLSWFIDSYLAIGAAPDRTDVNGAVFKA